MVENWPYTTGGSKPKPPLNEAVAGVLRSRDGLA